MTTTTTTMTTTLLVLGAASVDSAVARSSFSASTQPAVVEELQPPYDGTPMELLDTLRGGGFPMELPPGHAPSGWVTKADAEAMLPLIRSENPARHVRKAVAAELVFDNSTVGEQAIFFIAGHIHDEYPPSPSSIFYSVTPEDIERVWRERYGAD